eukprot:m.38438 g.38438  ORF g.38438 m.38438 type:complete len:146 (+) comp45280_c0_seq1:500-937(+)
MPFDCGLAVVVPSSGRQCARTSVSNAFFVKELHDKIDSRRLLEVDWAFVSQQPTANTGNVEAPQRKIFRGLMKRKQEAGQHFGLEWLREQMEAEGEGADDDEAAAETTEPDSSAAESADAVQVTQGTDRALDEVTDERPDATTAL